MNTYGMHSIHGRAPAIATGVATARPDLDVWVITGDGDGLSIGGNHLIHALRRNVNLNILLFNNRIYGLTKGQYSPTSEVGKVTKSTPFGSVDHPFNPLSVALGAEATFVARTHDLDRKHMQETFRAAHAHRGSSFVEIYQNCNVFNDGQFDGVTKKTNRAEMMIDLVHGEPILFGAENERGVMQGTDGFLHIVDVADVGLDRILVHDEKNEHPSLAFALARLNSDDHSPTPFGVFRNVERPEYAQSVGDQVMAGERSQKGPGDLERTARLERDLDGRLTVRAHGRSPLGSGPLDETVVQAIRRPSSASKMTGRTTRSRIGRPISSAAARPGPVTIRSPHGSTTAPRRQPGMKRRSRTVSASPRSSRTKCGRTNSQRDRAADMRSRRAGVQLRSLTAPSWTSQ